MDEGKYVQVEIDGPVAEIILNRPNQRNAVNIPMLEQLLEAVQSIDADESIRVVLLRAAGPVFCAGNDLKERAAMSVEDMKERRPKGQRVREAIEDLSKPCIAVVHGAAVAAGCEFAFACDFIIAGESASFRYPVGVRGSLGDTLRLPRIVGKAMAKELLYSGRVVEAHEARTMHLVNRVVPDDQLLDAVRSLAATIAEHESYAITATKRSLDHSSAADPDSVSRMEQGAIDAAVAFQGERGRAV